MECPCTSIGLNKSTHVEGNLNGTRRGRGGCSGEEKRRRRYSEFKAPDSRTFPKITIDVPAAAAATDLMRNLIKYR